MDGLLGASWVHVIGARARSVVFPFSPPSFSLFSPGLDPRSPTVVPPARSATNGNFFFCYYICFFVRLYFRHSASTFSATYDKNFSEKKEALQRSTVSSWSKDSTLYSEFM